MPFYEYQCDACGHRFEVMQSIKAPPVESCTDCGAPVRRILFPSAIIYKGSGFYATEYGRSTHNNPSQKSKVVDIPDSPKKSDESQKSTSTEASKGDGASPKKAAAPKAEKKSGSASSS